MAKKPLATAIEQLDKALLRFTDPEIRRLRDAPRGTRIYEVAIPGPLFCGLFLSPSSKHCGFTIEVLLAEAAEHVDFVAYQRGPEALQASAGRSTRFRLARLMSEELRNRLAPIPDDLALRGDFWWNLMHRYNIFPTDDDTARAFARIPAVVEHATAAIREAAIPWFVEKQGSPNRQFEGL